MHTLVADKPFNKRGANNKPAHGEELRFGVVVSNIDINYFSNMIIGRDETTGDIHSRMIENEADAKALAMTYKDFASQRESIAIAYVDSTNDAFYDVAGAFKTTLNEITGINWSVTSVKTLDSKYDKSYTLVKLSRAK